MNDKAILLDIAMNLNRMGNWAADNFLNKKNRIAIFLKQTDKYIKEFQYNSLPLKLKETYAVFLKDYERLEKEAINGPKDSLEWAERMMTWGNILTHRSNLIK